MEHRPELLSKLNLWFLVPNSIDICGVIW
jgi:hypothetical protein